LQRWWPWSHDPRDLAHQPCARLAVSDRIAAGVAAVFFSLGAYFAGALEIIVYAGAIMVLFVFVVMMLNLGSAVQKQERDWLKPSVWIGPGLLSLLLLAVLIFAIRACPIRASAVTWLTPKPWVSACSVLIVLAVELASMLLLAAGLVTLA
jgi:NADH-quinone oxidoreductase subunit J